VQTTLGRVLSDVVSLYLYLLFARVVLEWVMVLSRGWRPTGALIPIFELVYTVTDPPIKLMRRLVPPLRVGNVAVDLGFIIVFIALIVIQRTLLTQI
jgi:YggT family protein